MKKDVFATYEELRDRYHRICQKLNTDDLEDLKKACEIAGKFHWKLLGMLDLMQESELITEEQQSSEQDCLLEMFDSIKLYKAYIDETGELCGFREMGGDCGT